MKDKKTLLYHVVVFLLLLCITSIGYSQHLGNYKPIELEGFQAKWISAIYDSTIVGYNIANPRDKSTGFDGYSHVYYHPTIVSHPIIKDGYYYRVVWTSYDTDLSGGIIEKVDLESGKSIWKSVFDLRTHNKREFIKKAEIDGDRLVLYNIEILDKDPPLPIPIVFAFQAKGVLKIREYDLETGSLLNVITADTLKPNLRYLTTDLVNRLQIYRSGPAAIEVIEHVHNDNTGTYLILDTIFIDGTYVNSADSIKSHFNNVDWSDCHWSSSKKMMRDPAGKLFYIDSYIPGDFSTDKPRLMLRSFVFGEEMSSIELSFLNNDNHVDNWNLLEVKDNYILLYSANFDNTGDYVVVNNSGVLVNKYSFPGRNNDLSPALGPNGSLLFAAAGKINGKNSIEFYQSEIESFKLLSSFTFTDPKHKVAPSRLFNLESGDFILDLMHSEEDGTSLKGRFHSSIRFDPSQIGVITTTQQTNTIHSAILYPNPANNYLWIKSGSDFDEAVVSNSQGQNVLVVKGKVDEINISNMSCGLYILELKNNNKSILRQKFVKSD